MYDALALFIEVCVLLFCRILMVHQVERVHQWGSHHSSMPDQKQINFWQSLGYQWQVREKRYNYIHV